MPSNYAKRTNRNRPSRFLLMAAVVIALGGALASCSSNNSSTSSSNVAAFLKDELPGVSSSLVSQAEKEGTLTYYVGTFTQSTNNLIKGFNALFPSIKVLTYSAPDAQLRQKFTAEEASKHYVADLITSTDPGQLNALVKSGYAMHYTISNDDKYPAADKDAGYWYPLRISPVGIAWNTDKVSASEAASLDTWQTLTDPRWKGQAGIIDPSSGGLSLLPIYAFDKLYGTNFLRAVGADHPRVYANATAAASALASGEISVLFTGNETQLSDLYDEGAPIEWTDPTPAIGAVTGQAIAANAPHPAAAKLFQEYTFSLQGSKEWLEYSGLPARIGLTDQRAVAKQPWFKAPTQFFQYSPAAVTDDQAAIIKLFRQYIGS